MTRLPQRGHAEALVEWLQHGVLRLDVATTGIVVAALLAAVVLAARRQPSASLVVVLLACPFVVALLVCAARPLGVWFQ